MNAPDLPPLKPESRVRAAMREVKRGDALSRFRAQPSPVNAVRLAICDVEAHAEIEYIDALERAASICGDRQARNRTLGTVVRMLRRIAMTIDEASK